MRKYLGLKIILTAITVFIFIPRFSLAQEQKTGNLVSGLTQGTGEYFEIKNSSYLNIFLQSDKEITVVLESIPGLVNLKIGSSTDSVSANLVINGLEPGRTYYKYQDSHKSGAVFVSDENGGYSWTQDLAEPHHIWFMKRKGTIYIDNDTTLASDLNETVEITADNIFFDCDNHKISGPGSGFGIYVNNKKNVTIKNCRVSNFSFGAYFVFWFSGSTVSDSNFFENQTGIQTEGSSGWFQPNINLLRNKVYANSYEGISSRYCSGNFLSANEIFDNLRIGLLLNECSSVLRNNSLAGNKYNFGVYGVYSGLEQDIDVSNTINGKPIYYLVGADGITIDASFNAGYIGVVNSQNIVVKDVEINNNIQGIFFDGNSDSKIENVSVSSNQYGIELNRCSRCGVFGSRAENNEIGIRQWISSFSAFEKNILSNNGTGIYLTGMDGAYSHDNKVFHNNFIGNNMQVDAIRSYSDSFDDSYPSGGNYYSDYSGVDLMKGHGQDEPGPDNIGDTPYIFYGGKEGRYPLMKEFEINPAEPPQSWSFAIITDLHVGQSPTDDDYGDDGWDDGGSGDNNFTSIKNLVNTVDRINFNKQKYNIRFVVTDGDFTDSAELSELNKAEEVLDNLEIPWIPAIGNHDIWPYYGPNPDFINRTDEMAPENVGNMGTDRFFDEIFSSQYEKLATIFSNWTKEEDVVWNPVTDPEHNSLFQNFAFDYGDYHFIGLDFNSRDNEVYPLKGAAAEGVLHDFSGGTWQWFLSHLQQYTTEHPDNEEKIILLAHHPFGKDYWKSFYDFKLYNIGFSDAELTTIHEALVPFRDEVYALFAGHTHKSREYSFFGDTLKIVETAANVDGPLARLVQFFPDGRIDYTKMLGNEMVITAHSPVDLEVTDPDGLIINKQSNNYFEEDFDGDGKIEDQIQIPIRKEGNYRIRVIPEPGASPEETYSLDVSLLEDNFGYTPIILAQDVAIGDIPVAPYSFQPQERIATNISYIGDLSGFYQDSVNLSANLTDIDGSPLADKDIVFQIGEQSVSAKTDASGTAIASLILTQIPGNYYSIEANFVGDLNYLPAQTQADFIIKGAKWLKQDALSKLQNVQTGDKKLDSDIQKAKKHIEGSLADNLWLDDSHIIDRRVFEEEFSAVEILKNRILNKPKISQETRDTLGQVMNELVKVDELLAKAAIYDAENLSVENPKLQKKIERQIDEAKEWLAKAKRESSKNQPSKAIANFAVSWLHVQTAIKFAGLEKLKVGK